MTMTLGVLHTVVRADYVDGPPQGQWTGDDTDSAPVAVKEFFAADDL